MPIKAPDDSRAISALEALFSVVVGYFLSLAVVYIAAPYYGFDTSGANPASFVLLFVGVSFLRIYGLRRGFNGRRRIYKWLIAKFNATRKKDNGQRQTHKVKR